MFINAADTIIATGFAIPRSASVATSSPYLNSNKNQEIHLQMLEQQTMQEITAMKVVLVIQPILTKRL